MDLNCYMDYYMDYNYYYYYYSFEEDNNYYYYYSFEDNNYYYYFVVGYYYNYFVDYIDFDFDLDLQKLSLEVRHHLNHKNLMEVLNKVDHHYLMFLDFLVN